jgi:hypothetical protein
VFVDEFSRHVLAYPMRQKSEAADKFKRCLIEFQKLAPGHKVRFYRSDNALELTESIRTDCDANQITITTSAPHSPNQNGIAERFIGTLKTAMRAYLEQLNNSTKRQRQVVHNRPAPVAHWDYALEAAAFVKNKMVSSSTQRIPEEVITGRPVDVQGIRPFGCTAYVQNPSPASSIASKAFTTVLVGFNDNHVYKCLDIFSNQTRISRNVIFDETSILTLPATPEQQKEDAKFRQQMELHFEQVQLNSQDQSESESTKTQAQPEFSPAQASALIPEQAISPSATTPVPAAALKQATSPASAPIAETEDSIFDDEKPQVRRGTRIRHMTLKGNEYQESLQNQALKEIANYKAMLTTKKTAVPSEDEAWEDENWRASMEKEMESQRQNGTWVLVDLPPGRKAIGSKWHFRAKTSESSNEINRKSRLVAQGFSQIQGQDYTETYAPVCKMSSFRSLVAIAGPKNLKLEHLDVRTAFLQAELPEDTEIYMRQPRFFVQPGEESKVCLLKKGLYGLKQGQRCWNQKLDDMLQKAGFNCSEQRADICVYVKTGPDNELTILLVYVDDILVASNCESSSTAIKKELMAAFDIRDLGELKLFLGIQVERTKDGGYFLHQSKHAQDILEYFGMENCNSVQTPMDLKKSLKKRTLDERQSDQDEYRTGIGALLYLCNTRPILSQAVGVLSKFINDPSSDHEVAFKRVLRYLKGTINEGVNYKGQGPIQLEGWADADYAGDADDRRSTTGFVVTINGGPVSWVSKKQKTVALSSTEAEYVSMASLGQEVKWLRQLLQDMECKQESATQFTSANPTVIYEDNQGAIASASNPTAHQRMKHVDVKYHFIREQVENGEVVVKYCATRDMVADFLTKPLSAECIQRHKKTLGIGCRLD